MFKSMQARILDGRVARTALTEGLKKKIESLSFVPKLAIIQVGERPDSISFINAKKLFAKNLGVDVVHITIKENADQNDVLQTIRNCNTDVGIHGIIVQLPLPERMDANKIIEAIDSRKDVDCLTSVNAEKARAGEATVIPATARGIRNLLKLNNIDLKGKVVAVIGRSNLVGTPIAEMCSREGVEVIICHKGTKDLAMETQKADIIIVATGNPMLITAEHVKADQVIIDVGITRTADSGLAGDVDFDAVKDIVAAISPVPGGVGPMTVSALFENLIDLVIVARK